VNKTLLFFGNERIATGVTTTAPTLRALVENGYNVAALVTAEAASGPSRKGREQEIEAVAQQYGIPILKPAKLSDVKDDLAKFKAEAAVLVAYGKLVPSDVIDLFPKGIINIHPSLLPKHRGSAPIEGALLEGDSETGVSLMRLVQAMDAGPVYAQAILPLKPGDSKQFLADELLKMGKDLVIEHLPSILDGKLEAAEQNGDEATYQHRVSKADSELQFTEETAEHLAREVRAYLGWPRSKAMIGTTEVIVTEAHAKDFDGVPGTLYLEDKLLGIHAKQGTLIIDKLVPAGKKEMPASAFLTGYNPI
jgi:methionyl-tRNA formyltransferase